MTKVTVNTTDLAAIVSIAMDAVRGMETPELEAAIDRLYDAVKAVEAPTGPMVKICLGCYQAVPHLYGGFCAHCADRQEEDIP